MLHWNHWVLKEQGDPVVLKLIAESRPDRYESIFIEGDLEAFNAVRRELGIDFDATENVFSRYCRRRADWLKLMGSRALTC
jgi:hypothetical protein